MCIYSSRSGGHDDAEMSEGESQASNVEQDVKHKEIWRLFREAQQSNSLFLPCSFPEFGLICLVQSM